jgi:HK97 family phage portal protein
MGKLLDFLFGPLDYDTKSATTSIVPQHSPEAIEAMLREDSGGGSAIAISAVYAAARVIAEGLALPPCYLHQADRRGKKLATNHSLYNLLNLSPNDRQTSYEFREMLGWHLALNGEAHCWLNRSRATGEILEILPMNPSDITQSVDPSKPLAPIRYFLFGVEVPSRDVWHLKGPSFRSYEGMNTVSIAREAIGLARATQTYGAKLFENGARPSGLLTVKGEITAEQAASIATQWNANYGGAGSAHKTAMLSGDITYQPLASTANEAQFIEARRFQIEEICRFFRVSPTKVFQSLGSQSYASVEQAHIAHDQDTDAHWHARFVQSASINLLTAAERAAGYTISIDNSDYLRGTAKERMEYYTKGIAAGVFTRNEVRDWEGLDRSDDASADELTPAQNLFGPDKPAAPSA